MLSLKRIRQRPAVLASIAIVVAFLAGYCTSQASLAVSPRSPRIAPVPRADWTEQQRDLLKQYDTNGRIMNIYTTMANHPELMRDWLTFAGHVLRRNSLPAHDREVLILRIGWLCQSEYEWAQHVRVGRTAGLTDADIENIRKGPSAAGITENDRILMQAADELHKEACVSDATWAALKKHYDTKQMMDVVFTVGEYNLVSMALNSFGVQLEEGLTGFAR